jgi:hypothetical protein
MTPRKRDSKGRFIKRVKPPSLTPQQLGDATALTIFEEAEPLNCLATRAECHVHEDWWQHHTPI